MMLTAMVAWAAVTAWSPAPQSLGQAAPADNPLRMHQLRDLVTASVRIHDHTFRLWVMDTESKRAEGMMHLRDQDFADDQGMIFVFKRAQPQRFWMQNTYVPLDIAYTDADGTINSIYTMKAFDTETNYSSARPSMYVIELRAGMMKKKGIRVGDRFRIPVTVKAKE